MCSYQLTDHGVLAFIMAYLSDISACDGTVVIELLFILANGSGWAQMK